MHDDPWTDERTFEESFFESRRRLLQFLHRWLRDRHGAEDVLQETWLTALEGRANGASVVCDDSGETLARIALRIASRERRRAGRTRALGFEEVHARSGDHGVAFALLGRQWSTHDLIDLVLPELESMPSLERDLVVRRYEAQTPTASLARELGVTPNALRSRLKRARLRLRRAVERRVTGAIELKPARPDGPVAPAKRGVVR